MESPGAPRHGLEFWLFETEMLSVAPREGAGGHPTLLRGAYYPRPAHLTTEIGLNAILAFCLFFMKVKILCGLLSVSEN